MDFPRTRVSTKTRQYKIRQYTVVAVKRYRRKGGVRRQLSSPCVSILEAWDGFILSRGSCCFITGDRLDKPRGKITHATFILLRTLSFPSLCTLPRFYAIVWCQLPFSQYQYRHSVSFARYLPIAVLPHDFPDLCIWHISAR